MPVIFSFFVVMLPAASLTRMTYVWPTLSRVWTVAMLPPSTPMVQVVPPSKLNRSSLGLLASSFAVTETLQRLPSEPFCMIATVGASLSILLMMSCSMVSLPAWSWTATR